MYWTEFLSDFSKFFHANSDILLWFEEHPSVLNII
jgi:hypothetical protein